MTTTQIIYISVFGVYILGCLISFAIMLITAVSYRDLGKGLLHILERRKEEDSLHDIADLAEEISKYFTSYSKLNPYVHKRYACTVNWLDDVLVQSNMFDGKKHKIGTWFHPYYKILTQVQNLLEERHPFYRCTPGQIWILQDIALLKTAENGRSVESVLQKTEDEFVNLAMEGKKNERNNRYSIAIGIAGILVSVLLTVIQMLG